MFASTLEFYDWFRISHIRCAMMEPRSIRRIELRARLTKPGTVERNTRGSINLIFGERGVQFQQHRNPGSELQA
jgi:hypothetical protein